MLASASGEAADAGITCCQFLPRHRRRKSTTFLLVTVRSGHACSMPCRVQVNRFSSAQREKKASWTSLRLLAKIWDLSDWQINVLAIIVRQAQIKRLPRILGSIQLLDKSVKQAQERIGFSESQMLLIDPARKKLV